MDDSTIRKRAALDSQNLHVEELGLPQVLESRLLDALKSANGSLPDSAKTFLDWEVAMLPRFVESGR